MDKKDILIKNGTYNKNHDKVQKKAFQEDEFYDPMDVVQVRYEMIKDASGGGRAIEQVTSEYGYSRASYYHIMDNFKKGGMLALVPEKTGPKTARKLTDDLREYVTKYIEANPSASSSKIASEIQRNKGIAISKRTIERFRSKKKP